jgi:tellurite resistance protein TehA-like permease
VSAIATSFALFLELIVVIFLSVMAFLNNGKPAAILFMLTGGISLIFAFYFYDIFTDNLGLTTALAVFLYAIFCIAMGFRMLFWKEREE